MFVVPNFTNQILCMLDGLELSLQGSGIEYIKYIGYLSCFPPKHEATVEGRVELD